jgi:hypothetical protein
LPPALGRRPARSSRCGVYWVKPVLRGWLHLVWFGASLVAGTVLVARAHGVPVRHHRAVPGEPGLTRAGHGTARQRALAPRH